MKTNPTDLRYQELAALFGKDYLDETVVREITRVHTLRKLSCHKHNNLRTAPVDSPEP